MKWGLVGAAILALVGAGIVGVGWMPLSVSVAAPEKNIAIRVFGLGTLEARVVSKISFEVGAALTELKVDHGDRVKRGDVLARLHAAEQEAKVAKAKADLQSAQVAVSKAEANSVKARAVAAQREATSTRKKELAFRGFVSAQTVEEVQRDADVARAEATVAARDIEVARAQVENARALLLYEQTILDHHTLHAPFDAVVVERLKELGTVVRAGDPIFTLTDPESVWVLAYVDEARAGQIMEGQSAEVRLRSRPDQVYQGQIMRIGIESDRVNEERRIYVKCRPCLGSLQLGEQAEVLITVAILPKALLVSETAVQGFDGISGTVWTVEQGRLQRRKVKFGHRSEDARLEIVGGLPAGALVAIESDARFAEGRAVGATTVAP